MKMCKGSACGEERERPSRSLWRVQPRVAPWWPWDAALRPATPGQIQSNEQKQEEKHAVRPPGRAAPADAHPSGMLAVDHIHSVDSHSTLQVVVAAPLRVSLRKLGFSVTPLLLDDVSAFVCSPFDPSPCPLDPG